MITEQDDQRQNDRAVMAWSLVVSLAINLAILALSLWLSGLNVLLPKEQEPELAVSTGGRTELLVASGSVAFEEPAATARRGAAGARQQSGNFASEPLPESGAQSRGPVTHPEARSVLAHGGQMERRAGETGGEFPFEQFFAAPVPGGHAVPQIPHGAQLANLPPPQIHRLG